MSCRVTSTGILWALVSVLCALLCCSGYYLPYWIRGTTLNTTVYLGIFRRCNYLVKAEDGHTYVKQGCGRYTSFYDIPSTAWRACTVLIGIACGLLLLVCLTAVAACCARDVITKPTSKVAGLVQFFAGFLLAISLAAYPSGWSHIEVKQACGMTSDSYHLGDCTFSWAFYATVLGTALVFVCVGLSFRVVGKSHREEDDENFAI